MCFRLVYNTWNRAVVHPRIMQVRSGSGNIVYVTKTMNRKYHTRYTPPLLPFSNPIPAPKIPVGITTYQMYHILQELVS
jgi:hypothetical protein